MTNSLPIRRSTFRTAVAILVLCLAQIIHRSDAQEPASGAGASLKSLTLEQLGTIEVTAVSKEPAQVWRTPAAIYVVTHEDIVRSGATSIPEILRGVPGVQVSRIDSSTWAVGVRGFANGYSRSVLVLIDGRNVYTPLFAGVNWTLQNLPVEEIDRIEIIRGPGGTIWGTNAVNGVINIVTKKSYDSQGAFASLAGGNVDQGVGAFRFGARLGPHLSYRVYAMGFDRGPESHGDGNNFDRWQLGQGGFRFDWSSQQGTTATLQGDLYKGSTGQRETFTYYSPPSSANVDVRGDVSGGNLLVQGRHEFAHGSDIRVQAYYDRTYGLTPQLGETRNTFDVDFIHHLKGIQWQDLIWGVGARWSPSNFIQRAATLDFEPHHQADNIYSAFIQDEFNIKPNHLWLALGSKFEHNIYTGWETQPTARLTWIPSPRQTLWAAVTRAVRSPSRLEEDLQTTYLLATGPIPQFLRVSGNAKFKSETLLGYELGYRKLVASRFYVDVSAFHNKHNRLASFGSATTSLEPIPPPLHLVFTVPWINGIEGNTDGVEISPDWQAAHWLEFKASYSYLNFNLANKPGDTDATTLRTYEGSSPRHQLALQSLIELPGNLDLDLSYRYVSKLSAQYPSGSPSKYVRDYSTADARVAWHFGHGFDLSAVGRDLLQPSHAEFGGDPGPLVRIRRSGYAQVTWRK